MSVQAVGVGGHVDKTGNAPLVVVTRAPFPSTLPLASWRSHSGPRSPEASADPLFRQWGANTGGRPDVAADRALPVI
jgi:hypothetical protein